MYLKKLSDRIYYLPHEEETDRPVLGYIKGDKYSLAVDAGNSSKHVEKFYNELKKLNLRLPDFTVITHWHWDHTFGMHQVTGITISGHLTNKKLHEVTKWEWSDEAMNNRLENGEDIEMCDRCIKLEYSNRKEIKVVTSDIEFQGSMQINLGEIICELKEVCAPHSEDSVLVYVPNEKTLFVGDADCEDFYHNQGKYDKQKLNHYLELIKNIKFDTYFSGHSEPINKIEILNFLESELNDNIL